MATLTEALHNAGFYNFEGGTHSNFLQSHSLYYLTRSPVRTVMEIGFNTGHSSETFLQHPTTRVTSFDIGIHQYMSTAKQYIDRTYPGRHTLILGDSTQTVPVYIKEHPNTTFDLIYIDGGHDEHIVREDLQNALRLSHEKTLLVIDDVVYHKDWVVSYTMGPTTVWREYIENHRIRELAHVDYCPGRGMSWGIIDSVLPVNDIPLDGGESKTQYEPVVDSLDKHECPDPLLVALQDAVMSDKLRELRTNGDDITDGVAQT